MWKNCYFYFQLGNSCILEHFYYSLKMTKETLIIIFMVVLFLFFWAYYTMKVFYKWNYFTPKWNIYTSWHKLNKINVKHLKSKKEKKTIKKTKEKPIDKIKTFFSSYETLKSFCDWLLQTKEKDIFYYTLQKVIVSINKLGKGNIKINCLQKNNLCDWQIITNSYNFYYSSPKKTITKIGKFFTINCCINSFIKKNKCEEKIPLDKTLIVNEEFDFSLIKLALSNQNIYEQQIFDSKIFVNNLSKNVLNCLKKIVSWNDSYLTCYNQKLISEWQIPKVFAISVILKKRLSKLSQTEIDSYNNFFTNKYLHNFKTDLKPIKLIYLFAYYYINSKKFDIDTFNSLYRDTTLYIFDVLFGFPKYNK